MATVNLEVKAQVEDAIRSLGRVNKSFDLMGKANQDAAGALGVFGVSLTSLNSPLTLVATGMKAAIDYSVEWGNTIDDVQKITGQSAEETSKLVTVLGDFGIEANTLKGAAKALKEQGLAPNLETLKSLAKQYQSIQDPAERTAWGTKTLGRAFFDLSEVLTKTPAEFAAVEASAKSSGKVIGQDFVDDMEQAQIKAKQLQDKMDGLLLKIGPPLIDTVSAAATSFEQLGMIYAFTQIKAMQATGIITEQQAQLRIDAVAAGELGAQFTEQLVPALEDVTRGTDDVYRATVMHTTALEIHSGKVADDTVAVLANRDAQGNLNGVWGDAYTAIGNLTLAEEERQRIEDALAIASGKLTAEDILRREAVETLTKQYDNGLITQQQYIDKLTALSTGALTAKESIFGVRDAIASLSDKTVTVTYQQVGSENFGGAGDVYVSPYSGGTDNSNANYGGAQASGGDYMVTRPTWFLAGEAGPERATFTPQGKGGPGGGIYIGNVTVNALPGQDAEALWKQIRVIAARDARAMSQAGVRA